MQYPIILVLATRNQGKTDEIKALLNQFKIDIRNLEDFGPIPPIVEDGDTFEENAYKKASLTARYLGLPALADDSGLVVEALNGAPGVHSARYAGKNASDSQRYRKLLQELGDSENRAAKFVCVLSLAVPTGPALTYEAGCEGVITHEPVGTGGFGYDPVFFYPPLDKTFAQLTRQEKNQVSHRGKALHEFCSEFEKVMVWLQRHLAPHPPTGCMGSDL
ncbi:MAG: XTP/dITP diphosphatase [Desulfobacteraceae bacterium]|jgi:XTP/dITP diphosphohydrolase